MATKQMVSAVMTVTPAMAADWLKLNVDNNRAITEARVESYVRSIKNDEWQLTPEGIMFDTDGNLIDGQHRLTAISRAGKPVKMVVWTNVPFEVMEVLNTGVARTTADILTVTGGMGDVSGNAKVAVARASMIYRLHHPTYHQSKMTVSAFDWVKHRYEEDLDWAQRVYPLNGGTSHSLTTRRFRSPTCVAALVIAHKRDKEETEDFARKADKAIELTERDPAYALRKHLDAHPIYGGRSLERLMPAYVTFKCLYAAIHQQELGVVRTSFLTTENPEFNKILRYFGVVL